VSTSEIAADESAPPAGSVRSAILSRHPTISDEIQGAINTLRKLQTITGPPGERDRSISPDPTLGETVDGVALAPQAAEEEATYQVDAGQASAPARPLPTLAAGESFGRYQIVRLLGQGAMGSVYLAYDGQLQRHVALKTPFLDGGSQGVQRFLREARALAQVQSPYICPIHDVGHIGGIHYLSMAFVDGMLLSRRIARKPLGDERLIAALTQKIARGLYKAHEQGVIHRDLKCENIMIDRDGEPVVMDFGLARRLDDDVRLSLPGRLMGTPTYMSPEQVEGDLDQVGPASDMYSLGVILYEMLTGRVPFQGSLVKLLWQIVHAEPQRPSALNAAVPANCPLEQICLSMLAKSPSERFPSMIKVVEALEQVLPRQSAPAPRPPFWKRLFGRTATPALQPAPTLENVEAASNFNVTAAEDGRETPRSDDRVNEQTVDLTEAQSRTEGAAR
jgi:serine/threonine protein kinase